MAEAALFTERPARTTLDTMVTVAGLEIAAEIGVYAHEHGLMQRLVVDVVVTVTPPESDTLSASLDYQRIADDAQALGGQRIGLIETYARLLAEKCLAHPAAQRVEVRVAKPGALRNGLAGATVVMSRL